MDEEFDYYMQEDTTESLGVVKAEIMKHGFFMEDFYLDHPECRSLCSISTRTVLLWLGY